MLTADLADPIVEEALADVPKQQGRYSNLFVALAIHPSLAKRYNILAGLFQRRSSLPVKIREFIIICVGLQTRCLYELCWHIQFSSELGLDLTGFPRVALTDHHRDDSGPTLERAVDELCREQAALSDSTLADLQGYWSDAQIMEIIVLVGFYRMTAGILLTANVALDPIFAVDVTTMAERLLRRHGRGPSSGDPTPPS
jgi:alkylhydroperoxidase family enzyme